MNKLPLVSVLVAAYNVDLYIEKCIRSIENQTYSNIEIVVVDDCSTDSTLEICKGLALLDKRIRILNHTENRKLYAARNTGLDNALGEYIVFVDGDDWLAQDFVEYMIELISINGADMAISTNCFTSRDFTQIKKDKIDIWDSTTATANFLYSTITIGAWNKIYRKSFLDANKLRFKSLFTGEGYRFISDCSQRANRIIVGCRKVYYYRLNNQFSATTLPDIKQGLGSSETLDGIERDLIIDNKKIRESILHHRFMNCCYILRLIIELDLKDQYLSEYLNSLHFIKKNGLYISLKSNTIKHGLRNILCTIFPILICKQEIKRKNMRFSNDKNRLSIKEKPINSL